MKILIIEDNKQLAESLRIIVGTYYATEVAHTGEDAMQQIIDNTFDLVLLDLGLPDVPGIEVCRAIRQSN